MSQSKNNRFEKPYNCLFGRKYQRDCDNFKFHSINHEMYLHYQLLMRKDVILMKLKVYLGIEIKMCTHSE